MERLILIILFIIVNAFFVASEFALVSSRKTRLDQMAKKNKSAARASQALDHLSEYISAVQVGVTIASIGLGWVGEPALASIFQGVLEDIVPGSFLSVSAHSLAIITGFFIITYLQIVFGELIPKSLALNAPERVSSLVITPLKLFTFIFSPFVTLLTHTANLGLKVFGLPYMPPKAPHSEEEIKMILSQSAKSGALERDEVEMMYKVFRFGDIPIRTIMIPRTELMAFPVDESVQNIMNEIIESAHSRFPVYKESIDNIIGYFHVKDLLDVLREGKKMTTIQKSLTIRDIIHVPEEKRADDVLIEMRRKRIPIAVVDDEYGGTAGIVTKEDTVEVLTGEIQDEFEHPEADFRKLKNGEYAVNGLMPLVQFQQRFSITADINTYSTVGGLVFGVLGHEPKVGDVVQIESLELKVGKMDGRRIEQVVVKRLPQTKVEEMV